MDLEQRASEVRRQREQLGFICGSRPAPEAFRQEALACFRALRAAGTSAQQAAARLGLSALTLGHWGKQKSGMFAPVVVTPEVERAPVASRSRLIVHGPCGLRIEGLDVAGLAELLQRLR